MCMVCVHACVSSEDNQGGTEERGRKLGVESVGGSYMLHVIVVD